jgi:hypothetical protein
VIVQSVSNRDSLFDTLSAQVGAVIAADRTLRGLCDWVEPEAAEPVDLPVEGAALLKAGILPITLHYTTSDALGRPDQFKKKHHGTSPRCAGV